MAAYAATMDVLDSVPTVKPEEIRIAEYSQLARLTWNRPAAEMITERDALALYESHWDLV